MKLAGTNILCLRFPGGILFSSGTKWIPGCQPSYTAQIITRNTLLLDYFLGLQGSQLRIVLGCKDHNWGLAWWCDFFLWGQPLEIIRKYSAKKVQPLGFYFRHLRLDLFKSLFLLVKLNICVCVPFCMGKCIFSCTSIPWWHIFTCDNFCNFWTGAPGKKWAVRPWYYCPNWNRHEWVTSLQTNPNPATCVQKVLGQIPFLMSDLCKSSIVTVQKILVPNLVN